MRRVSFRDNGNTPFSSDEFTIAVTSGESLDIISFSISIGIGSSSQLLDGVSFTVFIMSL